MQKALVAAAAAAVLGVAGAASAADLTGGGFKDAPFYAPVENWAGFYFGGHVGGGWATLKVTDYDVGDNRFNNKPSGVFGGAQLGYNFQHGPFVYGLEVDLGGMDLGHTVANPSVTTTYSKIESGFYGDVTGRLGYSFDRWLVYGKGGYAFYNGKIWVNDTAATAWNSANSLNGWTAGGGIEYQVSPAWSVKVEYQYFDFGTQRLTVDSTDRYDNALTVNTVKAGINYHPTCP
jgi:opacity protein-like surface antigen